MMTIKSVTTDVALQKVNVLKGERYEAPVKNCTGLRVRLSPRSKDFISKVRDPATQKRVTVVLGDFNSGINIRDATDRYKRLSAKLDTAKATRDTTPLAIILDEVLNNRERLDTNAATIIDVIDLYYASKLKNLGRPDVVKSHFDRFIIPFCGDRPIVSITRIEISTLITEIMTHNGDEPARKVLSYLRKFFGWCVGAGYIEVNHVSPIIDAGTFEFNRSNRDRFLSREEIAQFGIALDNSNLKEDEKIGLSILLLTGVRQSELTNSQWKHVNLETGDWYLPPEITKNGLALPIIVPPVVIVLFKRLHAIHGDKLCCLGGTEMKVTGRKKNNINREEAVGGRDRSYLTKGFKALQKVTDDKGKLLLPFAEPTVLHDLRTTFSTHLNAKDHPTHVIEMALNHRKSDISTVYNKALLVPERRALLASWAAYLAAPTTMLLTNNNIQGITYEA
jgi:integrase